MHVKHCRPSQHLVKNQLFFAVLKQLQLNALFIDGRGLWESELLKIGNFSWFKSTQNLQVPLHSSNKYLNVQPPFKISCNAKIFESYPMKNFFLHSKIFNCRVSRKICYNCSPYANKNHLLMQVNILRTNHEFLLATSAKTENHFPLGRFCLESAPSSNVGIPDRNRLQIFNVDAFKKLDTYVISILVYRPLVLNACDLFPACWQLMHSH